MLTALDVAKYLIGLAQRDGKPITNLKLQMWLYYAWGYYWNLFKSSLFKDNMEVWIYLYVIKDVYDEYKIFDGGDIIIDDSVIEENKTKFNQQQQEFLSLFYKMIKENNTDVLIVALHKEKSWKKTHRNGGIVKYETIKEDFTNDDFCAN